LIVCGLSLDSDEGRRKKKRARKKKKEKGMDGGRHQFDLSLLISPSGKKGKKRKIIEGEKEGRRDSSQLSNLVGHVVQQPREKGKKN